MKRWALVLAGAIAAAGSAACRASPPTLGDPPPALENGEAERSYQQLLERYTGRAEVYSGFDTQLFAGATYQAWPFREARVKRLAGFQRMSPEEVEARLKAERADWEKFHVFELGAWTQDYQFDDFDQKDSVWRIALVAESVELLPAEVVRQGRVDQNVRALYPYMGLFWVQYRVAFPRQGPNGSALIPEGTKQLMLRLASTLGRADLRTAGE
ncbi:MAG TPA: hypothetical protein VE549_12680 [Myxococcaceae bacterium]|nr:hypothetical protein [Myxococcaceae bacterium]